MIVDIVKVIAIDLVNVCNKISLWNALDSINSNSCTDLPS